MGRKKHDLHVAKVNVKLERLKGAGADKPTLYQFIPQCTWWDENFESVYMEGLSYFVREGNDKLHAAVQDWKALGMVKV